jgi:hypothetical protein
MTHKLKVLGIAMVAVFAVSAIMATAASAGQFTSTGKTKLASTEKEATLTAFGLKVTCHSFSDIGNVNETPHGFISSGATTFTVTPTLTGCFSFIGETKVSSTVTLNGCDSVLHIGSIIGGGPRYNGSGDIVCPAGKEIEIHAYSSAAHSSTLCTVKIPAQSGLSNGTIETSGSNLKLGGPVKGMKATKTGILCGGSGETTTGEQDISAEITGTNEAGSATAISVSGS